MTRSTLLAVASLFALSTTARADEVVLQDGRKLYGPVEERAQLLIVATRDGDVAVPRSEVVRIRGNKELRADLLGLASRCGHLSAFSCLHLAFTARDWNLPDEMWSYLDRALAHQDMPADVRQRLDEFLGTLEPEVLPSRWRKSVGPIKAREIVHAMPAKCSPARRAASAHVLARLDGIDKDLRTTARAAQDTDHRLVANEAIWLQWQGDGNDKGRDFVLRSAVFDNAPEVRSRVVELATAAEITRVAADYVGKWLVHKHPKMNIRAAEALGALGEPSAVDALVSAGPYAASGNEIGERAHVAFITQQSYIRDFDVEVAQSSFIADPKVDALSYGSVLDVRVGAVVTQRIEIVKAYRAAIGKLEGTDPGADPAKWATWLAARRSPQR
ncbi:MAG: hypothetical protein R3F56_06250 [Planctomycetota bacterium]